MFLKKMLVVSPLVSKGLYMILKCFGGSVMLNSWLDNMF
jgi:hypothetical protein